MFKSFTGNSRRPRQVNLASSASNRTRNPFAQGSKGGSSTPTSPLPTPGSSTLAQAQMERMHRQKERGKLNACRTIQRRWRGYQSRKTVRAKWREAWDKREVERNPACHGLDAFPGKDAESMAGVPYDNADDMVNQLRLLAASAKTPLNSEDALRLAYFSGSFLKTEDSLRRQMSDYGLQFALLLLDFMGTFASPGFRLPLHRELDLYSSALYVLTQMVPEKLAAHSQLFFSVMASLTMRLGELSSRGLLQPQNIMRCVTALPQQLSASTINVYEWLARLYLTVPDLNEHLQGSLHQLAHDINYKILGQTMVSQNVRSWDICSEKFDDSPRLWLLAHYIYLHRYAFDKAAPNEITDPVFAYVVSVIVGACGPGIPERIALNGNQDRRSSSRSHLTPLPTFVQEQLSSLINQGSVTQLLSHVAYNVSNTYTSQSQPIQTEEANQQHDDAKSLAAYALTLLRLFPHRGDEIRMWLYLGSAKQPAGAGTASTYQIPAIKYFWNAVKQSLLFRKIATDSSSVLATLLPASEEGNSSTDHNREQDWTLILIFLELYTFLLKVLDDEEFFSEVMIAAATSWTQESALPLREVMELTFFLKNLAFTLYWHASDLTDQESTTTYGLSVYFANLKNNEVIPSFDDELPSRNKARRLPGVADIPLDYFKGLVTGLLRMIHERDSRRQFLPKGHWLMTDKLDMEAFISRVVYEEERRHELQEEGEAGDDDGDLGNDHEEDDDEEYPSSYNEPMRPIGTERTQQIRRFEAFKKRQTRFMLQKELEAVAPRLEILRNIPFFIPFRTRVEIFRQFVLHDQQRRRGMHTVDPESWRLSLVQESMTLGGDLAGPGRSMLEKHHADVRRDHIFDDAYEQFYGLDDGFKEPIHISFIDKFGAAEAGIDGGGVTKEFLTSVIEDSFKPASESSFFYENDMNLLYPNPSSVEQRKETLRLLGVQDDSPEFKNEVRHLLRQYEFLGRIIGKCLYEGILVDVRFAGFFLLKWALTGGTGSAGKESSYRASINDVRDLDQELYQGLLRLKNYDGNVENLELNFTIDDTTTIEDPRHMGVKETVVKTHELRPGGTNMAVTNQNRLVYISYVARHRLQVQPYQQTAAFLQGLGRIVQPSWLSMFNQSELQTLVGGDQGAVDVDDFRRNVVYGGLYVIGDDGLEHPTIQMFWDVVRSMDNNDRQKLLKFVTSTPRAPLLGFSHLNPPFSIRDSSHDVERLPSTSTCANLLKLPLYQNTEQLRKKLLYAINADAGFDLS